MRGESYSKGLVRLELQLENGCTEIRLDFVVLTGIFYLRLN